ncbi:Rpn family recombination-promoting nuclease/putative transposase [Desulfonatronum thiodismutans]|uniref:Rpn family recombination-promoting nuclease/putative transposase n=1 Tax=Desulfonatronum thiodismutans TaxID=159290 RepID=UPI003898F2DD
MSPNQRRGAGNPPALWEVAANFLANYLPDKVLKHIRLDTLTINKDSFVGRSQADQPRYAPGIPRP